MSLLAADPSAAYTDRTRALRTTDLASAAVLNALYQDLLNNDATLKTADTALAARIIALDAEADDLQSTIDALLGSLPDMTVVLRHDAPQAFTPTQQGNGRNVIYAAQDGHTHPATAVVTLPATLTSLATAQVSGSSETIVAHAGQASGLGVSATLEPGVKTPLYRGFVTLPNPGDTLALSRLRAYLPRALAPGSTPLKLYIDFDDNPDGIGATVKTVPMFSGLSSNGVYLLDAALGTSFTNNNAPGVARDVWCTILAEADASGPAIDLLGFGSVCVDYRLTLT